MKFPCDGTLQILTLTSACWSMAQPDNHASAFILLACVAGWVFVFIRGAS